MNAKLLSLNLRNRRFWRRMRNNRLGYGDTSAWCGIVYTGTYFIVLEDINE